MAQGDGGSDAPAVPRRRERGEDRILRAEAELARVAVELAARAAESVRTETHEGLLEVAVLLERCLRSVHTTVQADAACLRIYDQVRNTLRLETAINVPDVVAAAGDGSSGLHAELLRRLEPLAVGDIRHSAFADAPDVQGFAAVYAVPLLTLGQELMGSITLYCLDACTPTEREIRLIEAYARQAAEMIERARLHGEARALASLEQRRAMQLRTLAETALVLTPLRSLEEIVRVVTERAMEIIGTHQAVTSHLEHGWSKALTWVSLSEKYARYRAFDEVPKGRGVLNYVTRENRPLRLTGEQLRAHPEWRGLQDAPDHPPLPDYLAVPLIARDGSNLGLIQLSDKVDGTDFSAEDEAMLVQLAQMASVVIENAVLLEREREARAAAEERARLRGLLSDASRAFSASLDADETIRALARAVVPEIGDWACVHLLAPNGDIELATVTATDEPTKRAVGALLGRLRLTLDMPYGAGAVIRTGASQLFPDVPDEVLETVATDDVSIDELRALAVESAVCVPLSAHDRTFGCLTLAKQNAARYTQTELEFAEDLAQRAALALSNAARYASERAIAATLQRSLLPQVLPRIEGLQLAVRYLPASAGGEIGGDWYDLVPLPEHRVGVVVGDVMGRGIPAAAIMGQLRAAVRAYALEGHRPSEVLARTDRVVQALGTFQITTCLYGVFDRSDGTLTVASAGHLPPMIVQDGEAYLVSLSPNRPLGAGDGRFEETVVHVPDGATVLLYTDGLVEGPDCPVDEGLRVMLEGAHGAVMSPDELCDRVLRALGRDGEHDDDTALLAFSVGGIDTVDDTEAIELEPHARAAAEARAFVTAYLEKRAVAAERIEAAILLVSELVTNAVRHARTELEVAVSATPPRVRVEVRDRSNRLPAIRTDATERDEWGRGMVLVDAMASRWGSEVLPTGKLVWFEMDRAGT